MARAAKNAPHLHEVWICVVHIKKLLVGAVSYNQLAQISVAVDFDVLSSQDFGRAVSDDSDRPSFDVVQMGLDRKRALTGRDGDEIAGVVFKNCIFLIESPHHKSVCANDCHDCSGVNGCHHRASIFRRPLSAGFKGCINLDLWNLDWASPKIEHQSGTSNNCARAHPLRDGQFHTKQRKRPQRQLGVLRRAILAIRQMRQQRRKEPIQQPLRSADGLLGLLSGRLCFWNGFWDFLVHFGCTWLVP
jgi:hypothetical protein